ncbi:hypothetical protein IL306_010385 [Fusarium sp. DS 682]|nr:hypothetical protein IL306_010385 [Fusarium sp. DS 682]
MRGLADASFVEIPSEIDTNSTFGWRDASDITSALEKRDYPKPDQCWKYPRGIGGSVSQYKSDLGKLRADMDSDIGSLTLPPMSTHKASRGIASVIVRNQDNCVTVSLKYYIKGIEDFCDDHSGWV